MCLFHISNMPNISRGSRVQWWNAWIFIMSECSDGSLTNGTGRPALGLCQFHVSDSHMTVVTFKRCMSLATVFSFPYLNFKDTNCSTVNMLSACKKETSIGLISTRPSRVPLGSLREPFLLSWNHHQLRVLQCRKKKAITCFAWNLKFPRHLIPNHSRNSLLLTRNSETYKQITRGA